jgi:hypothetical protein
MQPAVTQLYGIGLSQSPYQSSSLLPWEDTKGNGGKFQLCILSHLPVNLWGWDILKAMGLLILIPNQQVTYMMLSQGFDPEQAWELNIRKL